MKDVPHHGVVQLDNSVLWPDGCTTGPYINQPTAVGAAQSTHRHQELKLWKVFPDLDDRVVQATRDLIKMKPWTMSKEQQRRAAFMWISIASHAYGIDPPHLVFDGRMRGLIGEYHPHRHTIRMKKFSVVTLLHEFRHAMQARRNVTLRPAGAGTEEDAMAWSLSMFRAAAPRRFRRLLKAGRIRTEVPE